LGVVSLHDRAFNDIAVGAPREGQEARNLCKEAQRTAGEREGLTWEKAEGRKARMKEGRAGESSA